MAENKLTQQDNVDSLRTTVSGIEQKLGNHDTQIVNVQALTFFGFIIALITLAGVVITSIAFVVTQINQTNQQTVILQEIKDKLAK